ncbi:hypothetical protein ACLI4Q_09330 [Natrialbaceae archaeon A-CW1-1]
MQPHPHPAPTHRLAPRVGVSIAVLVVFFGLLVALSYPTLVVAAISGALAVSTYNRVRTWLRERDADRARRDTTRARLWGPQTDR